MQRASQRFVQRLAVATIAVTAACLGSRVPDQPGASANLLPANANVLELIANPDLTNQVTLNDGLDTDSLTDPAHPNVIVRGTGKSAGSDVRFWAFGKATRAPAPIYLFGKLVDGQLKPLDPAHLPLVEAIPGDYQYNPIHSIYHVVPTAKYRGELITTTAALADAIELGLVEAPIATGTVMCRPIVRPGLALEVDTAAGSTSVTVAPTKLYGRGYLVDSFELGQAFSPQPNPKGLLLTRQVSYLRQQTQGGSYDHTRPIFQATIPTDPPPTGPMAMANYTPLSVVVDVDLESGTTPAEITSDDQLFKRSTGMTQPAVAQFTVTSTSLLLQLQFTKGEQ
jgi:hypothetical protein